MYKEHTVAEVEADEYVNDNTVVEVDEEYYDDAYDDEQAFASAGWGTDESYGFYGSEF